MKTITHFSAIKKAAFVMFLVLMGYTSFAQTTYCSDSVLLGGGTTEYIQIDSVVIKGTSLHNYTPGNINTYRSFPAADSTTATLQQGATYTLVVNTGIFEVSKVGVWIDYNHNGTFDPAEYISVPVTPVAGNQVVTFTVPFAALTGETGMRIRNAGGGIDSSSACSYLFSGETEEYIITIDTTYPCTGTPIVGAISGKDSACVVDTFTLFTTGGTLAAGLTYQWLSRPSGTGSFTAIAGATSSTYTAYGLPATTDLEVRVTCTGSGLSSTSASYTIYELPFYRCYCDSASIGGSTSYVTLDNVGIVGTTLNNYTPGNIFPTFLFQTQAAPPAAWCRAALIPLLSIPAAILTVARLWVYG